MARRPGKYDDLCTVVRERSDAEGAVVIIINGNRGQGFSAQMSDDTLRTLPRILELVAQLIRDDFPPLH